MKKSSKSKVTPRRTIIKNKFESCEYCGCKSKVYRHIQACNFRGDALVCPGEIEYPELHDQLIEKLERLDEGGHPKSYVLELIKEIKEIERKFSKIKPLVNDDY